MVERRSPGDVRIQTQDLDSVWYKKKFCSLRCLRKQSLFAQYFVCVFLNTSKGEGETDW